MYFESAIKARKYCTLEIIRTHKRHIVVPSKKYIPYDYFGRDYVNGFTVVLWQPKVKY